MSDEQGRELAEKMFPGVDFGRIVYVARPAWFRYAFYIASMTVFVLIFAFAVVYQSFAEEFGESGLLISWAGLLISPLMPLLYYWRLRTGGYLVDERTLYMKEGFFFEKTRAIPLTSIASAERVKEKLFNLPRMGHLKLELSDGEQMFVLDVQQPELLLVAIGQQ